MHPYEIELIEVIDALQVAHDAADKLPDELAAFKIRVQNKTRLEINVLQAHLGGGMSTGANHDLPPITQFMGEEIIRHKPVEPQDIQPTDIERDDFIRDRDNLYSQFLELKNEQIYAKAKQPGGAAVVRACAKKAGVDNYADAKMGEIFIKQIKAAITAENELNAALKEAEDKLK